MSSKITEARIEELKVLKSKRDELVEKIKEENEGMEIILNSMTDETKDLIQSSSRQAKTRREEESSNLTPDEFLEARQKVVERLQENYEKAVEELETLEKLIASEDTYAAE
jgi:hypothetical protein